MAEYWKTNLMLKITTTKTNEPSNKTIGSKMIGLHCGINVEDGMSNREKE